MCNNPKRRKAWIGLGQPSISETKPNIHVKKVLLSVWWNWKEVIDHNNLRKPDQTVTAEHHQAQWIKSSDTLKERRPFRDQGRRMSIFLHDNTRLHTAKPTQKFINSLGWKVLQHEAYSPLLLLTAYSIDVVILYSNKTFCFISACYESHLYTNNFSDSTYIKESGKSLLGIIISNHELIFFVQIIQWRHGNYFPCWNWIQLR